ncbi:MAG: non-homologous end-joining DNA ligase [Candidatus Bathyarchaeota archaeon]|nr:non-homologous end-joining DNA ligase [Candidatus Bathyarchaeota archaeon]
MSYRPMLAEPADAPFGGAGWLFEVKWDGIRAIAHVGETLSIMTRNDNDVTHKFPELNELSKLTSKVVLDGEIIVMKGGRPDFQAVAKRVQASKLGDIEREARESPCTYVVFDILEKDGEPLTGRPLSERKAILRESLRDGEHVVVSSYVVGEGEAYYEAAVARGLEGVVAKRLDSPYRAGERSREWLKVKRVRTVDCVVVGYTRGTGNRADTFGALLLGLYDGDKLTFVGRVGTGFTDKSLRELLAAFRPYETAEQQAEAPDVPAGSTWLRPGVVAEVGYQNLTDDDRLRAPRFLRLRTDKAPRDCTIAQVRPVTLEEYNAKRNFSKSPEPVGEGTKPKGGSYVVQEHHARHLHWDLRLERDGVLKSWAVPKGPPEKPGERRLAVAVEDHPLDYGGFEGTIPEGEYGAGTVKIWDRGTYEAGEWGEEKIEFTVHGERLSGPYELVRFRKAGEKNWLLFKKRE